MHKIILVVIVLVLAYMLIYKPCETFINNRGNVNMDKVSANDIKVVDNVNSQTKQEVISNGKRIELTEINKCTLPYRNTFENNSTYLVNDSNIIYQDITKGEQKSFIDNEEYKLTQVAWSKSFLNYKGEPIQLETHFIHTNPNNGSVVRIIVPHFFTDNETQIEKFTEVVERFVDTEKSIPLLNTVIFESQKIPNRIPNMVTTTPIQNSSLCSYKKLDLDNIMFYVAKSSNGDKLLYLNPVPFNKSIGENMLRELGNITYDMVKN